MADALKRWDANCKDKHEDKGRRWRITMRRKTRLTHDAVLRDDQAVQQRRKGNYSLIKGITLAQFVLHTDNLEGLEDAIDGVWSDEDKDANTGYAVYDALSAKKQRIMQTGVVEFVITLCEKLGELEDAVQYNVPADMETHQVLSWVQPDKLYEVQQEVDPKTFVKNNLKGYHERFVKHSKLPAAKHRHALARALTKFKTVSMSTTKTWVTTRSMSASACTQPRPGLACGSHSSMSTSCWCPSWDASRARVQPLAA
jgi:hypothetical protein